MKKRTVIKNGRLVTEGTSSNIFDKVLSLTDGYQVTQDGDIPVGGSAFWNDFNYSDGSVWQPTTVQCIVQTPFNNISYGTSGAATFVITSALGDVYTDSFVSTYKIRAARAFGVSISNVNYIFTGNAYGPEDDFSRCSIQKQNGTANRDINIAFNKPGKPTSHHVFNAGNYIAFNEGTQFSELRKFTGFATDGLSLVHTEPGATYLTYYGNLYYYKKGITDKYYQLDEDFVSSELTQTTPGLTPKKIIEGNFGSMKGFALYKEEYESYHQVGFINVTGAINAVPFDTAGYTTALGANLKVVDAVKVNTPNSIVGLFLDETKDAKGIQVKVLRDVGTVSESVTSIYIDSEFSSNSKIFYLNNVLYILANPRLKTAKTAEIFYSTDEGITWSKVRVENFTYKANEITFSSVALVNSKPQIVGYLNKRNSQVANSRIYTTVTLRGQ